MYQDVKTQATGRKIYIKSFDNFKQPLALNKTIKYISNQNYELFL